jgi:hypothetical protein
MVLTNAENFMAARVGGPISDGGGGGLDAMKTLLHLLLFVYSWWDNVPSHTGHDFL